MAVLFLGFSKSVARISESELLKSSHTDELSLASFSQDSDSSVGLLESGWFRPGKDDASSVTQTELMVRSQATSFTVCSKGSLHPSMIPG